MQSEITNADLFAWVSIAADGRRTLVGMRDNQLGGWLPLLSHDRDVMERLGRRAAELHAVTHWQAVELVRFSYAGVIERIAAGGGPGKL